MTSATTTLLWQLLTAAAGSGPGPAQDAPAAPSGWMGHANLYIVVAGMIILLFTLMRMKRRTAARPAKMSTSADFADQRRTQAGIDRLAVDLEETARSVSALLDTKIRVLDKLIHDADERIARLEGLQGGPVPAPAGERPAAAEPVKPPPPPIEEHLAHHRHIYGLADQGLSVQQIAEKSGHPVGEVELVLSLRKIKGKPAQESHS